MAKENEGQELILQRKEPQPQTEKQEVVSKNEEVVIDPAKALPNQDVKTQTPQEKNENAPKGYKRVDTEGGVLTDEDEINYFKTIQRREVLNNYMLGDFNSTGDYVLKEPMMKELVIMKKFLIDSYFNNVYFVKSALITREVGNLQFCVMIKTSKDGNKATAILKLLEPVTKAGGYIQNTNSFTVATYTDDNDNYFLSKVKKVFNIFPPEDPDVKQDEEEVAEIMARLAMRSKIKLLGASVYTKIEKEHYSNRIEVLRKGGYDDVLEELNKLMEKAKVFLKPDDPNYYKTVNDLIDQAVDNIGRKNPKRLKDIKKALLAANKDYIGKCDEAEDVIKGYKEKADLKEKLEKDAERAAQIARQKAEAEQAAAPKPSKPKAKAPSKPKAKGKKPQVKKPAKKKAAEKESLFFLGRNAVGESYAENLARLEREIRAMNAIKEEQATQRTVAPPQAPPTRASSQTAKTIAEEMVNSVLNNGNRVKDGASAVVQEVVQGPNVTAASILGGNGVSPTSTGHAQSGQNGQNNHNVQSTFDRVNNLGQTHQQSDGGRDQ